MKQLFLFFGIVLLLIASASALTIDAGIGLSADASDATYVAKYDLDVTNVTFEEYNILFDEINLSAQPVSPTNIEIYPVDLSVRNFVSEALLSSYDLNLTSTNASGSWSNTNPKTIILFNGTFTTSIDALGYESGVDTFTTTGLLNEQDSVYLNPYMTFSIRNEIGGGLFPVNSTDSIALQIYCPNDVLEFDFDVGLNQTSFTEAVTCQWEYMVLTINYATVSYFRTLVPAYNSTEINWYMIDLDSYSAYQIILKLSDLTGEYSDGTVQIKKVINGTDEMLIEQYFDAESKAVLYLIKDGFYSITLNDGEGNLRNLNYLQADSAGTKQINIPNVEFVPSVSVAGNLIAWHFDGNSSLVRFLYDDDSRSPSQYVNFLVFNGTNTSQTLVNTTQLNVASGIFSYVGNINESYKVCFESLTAESQTFSECVIYQARTGSIIDNSGTVWSQAATDAIIKWAVICLLLIILAYVGTLSPAAALGIAAVAGTFLYYMGWFLVVNEWFTISIIVLMGLGAALSAFFEVNK